MKILLDHNLDRRLKRYLADLDVSTTQEKRWSDLSNGELLSAAECEGFDVLMTADANIRYQQNLAGRKISILILRAPNNRLTTHAEMVGAIVKDLETIRAGSIVEILHPDHK